MEDVHALVANEPSAHRETITEALRVLRPFLLVSAAEPREPDSEVSRLLPHLVICSRLTTSVDALVPAWAVLYPGRRNHAVSRIDEGHEKVPNVGLDHLLLFVDRANGIAQDHADEAISPTTTVLAAADTEEEIF